MKGFIPLHRHATGGEVHVNFANVLTAYRDGPDKTALTFGDRSFQDVRETPEEIAALIAKAEHDEAEEAMARYSANVRSSFEAAEAVVAPWKEKVRHLETALAEAERTDPTRDYDDLFQRSLEVALALGDAKKMILRLADALESAESGLDDYERRHADLIAEARALAGEA